MISTHSDKYLLQHAIGGDIASVEMLARRHGYTLSDPKAVQRGLKSLKVLSVTAAKRIIQANATTP